MKEYRLYMLYFWLCASVLIFAKVYYSPHGYVTPDGGNYLKLARNLTEGKGMYVHNPCMADQREYFAKWPAAYPALIATVSMITKLPVIWASKLLNLLLLAGTMLLLNTFLKQRSFFILPLLFTDTYIGILCNSWSENLFIFGIVLSLLAADRLSRRSDLASASLLLLSILIIFLSRYAGIVVFAWLACIGIIFLLRKQRRQFWLLVAACGISLIACIGYLFINLKLNGNPTGLNRGLPLEDYSSLFSQTIQALAFEFAPVQIFQGPGLWFITLPLAILSATLFLWYVYKRRFFVAFTELHFKSSDALVLTGLFWWISIIIFRWNIHFDRLDYRLLGPGTILIFAGLWTEFIPVNERLRKLLIAGLLVLPLLFVTLNIWRMPKYKAFDAAESLRKELYGSLPANSMILFGENNIRYLFDHVYPYVPKAGEKIADIEKKAQNCHTTSIWIRPVSEYLDTTQIDVSIRELAGRGDSEWGPSLKKIR